MRALSLNTDPTHPTAWLKRTSFAVGDGTKDEEWFQKVLFENSDLIPISDILPGTGGFIPVCRELTIPKAGGSVFLDLFGVTPEGKPVLVECKLWRNPQARREVIAQTLEYASLIRRWSFGDLTAQVNKRLGTSDANPLFRIVSQHHPDINEGQFVDQVSRALKTGDFVLIIAGDGIRSDVHAIADHLNQTSGLNSRMALVEFQLWENDRDGLVIIPTIPLRTELVQHRVFLTDTMAPRSPLALLRLLRTIQALSSIQTGKRQRKLRRPSGRRSLTKCSLITPTSPSLATVVMDGCECSCQSQQDG